MSDKYKIAAAGLLLLLLGVAIGRYTKPDKVKIQTQVVETEDKTKDQQKQTQIDKNKHVTTTKIEIIKKDGTKEIKTKTVEDDTAKQNTEVTLHTTDDTTKKMDKTVEITNHKDTLSLNFLAGAKFKNTSLQEGYETGPFCYGGLVSKKLLGPISLGAWGLSCGQGGLSIGLSF